MIFRRSHLFASVGLAVLWGLAFALRALNVGWDAPFNYHPDEHRIWFNAMTMVADGTLDPRFHAYPSFLIYCSMAFVKLVHAIDPSIPLSFAGLADGPPGQLSEDQHIFVRGARWISAGWGALAAPAVAWAALRVRPALSPFADSGPLPVRAMPWLAGGIVAGLPIAVEHGHFATTDGAAGALATLALLTAVLASVAEERLQNLAVAAGVALGLAAATKYTAGIACLAVAAGVMVNPTDLRARTKALATAAAASVAVFLFWNPYFVIEPSRLVDALGGEATHYYVTGHHGAMAANRSWGRLLAGAFRWDVFATLPSIIALMAAFSLAFRREPKESARVHRLRPLVPALAYALGFLAIFGPTRAWFDRSLLLGMPLVAVGLVYAAAAPRGRRVWAGILAAALVSTSIAGVHAARVFGKERTETLAFAWFEDAVPAGATVIVEWYGPPLYRSHVYAVGRFTVSDVAPGMIDSIPADLIAISSTAFARFAFVDINDPESVHRRETYRSLFARGATARFCPDDHIAGPDIWIFAQSDRARAATADSVVSVGECTRHERFGAAGPQPPTQRGD